MNENLFAPFVTPMMMGSPVVILIIMFPSILFPTSKRLINNHMISLQQWLIQLMSKQMMGIHNHKEQTCSLMLMSHILFIGSAKLLGLLPRSFSPTTQLSMNVGMAIPLWASAVITGFRNKTKASLAHFLQQGTLTLLIRMLVISETISLFIQPVALAVWLTASITAGHLLMHLISDTTLVLMSTSTFMALITFIILALLTILEFAVTTIQAYVFTLLVSLYLHDNT